MVEPAGLVVGVNTNFGVVVTPTTHNKKTAKHMRVSRLHGGSKRPTNTIFAFFKALQRVCFRIVLKSEIISGDEADLRVFLYFRALGKGVSLCSPQHI